MNTRQRWNEAMLNDQWNIKLDYLSVSYLSLATTSGDWSAGDCLSTGVQDLR